MLAADGLWPAFSRCCAWCSNGFVLQVCPECVPELLPYVLPVMHARLAVQGEVRLWAHMLQKSCRSSVMSRYAVLY